MATQRIDLGWHVVSGRYEVEEMLRDGLIKEWHFGGSRHKLFQMIKYPDQMFYKGDWGPEILFYDKTDNMTTGQLGKIYATATRAEAISKWIRDHQFLP